MDRVCGGMLEVAFMKKSGSKTRILIEMRTLTETAEVLSRGSVASLQYEVIVSFRKARPFLFAMVLCKKLF